MRRGFVEQRYARGRSDIARSKGAAEQYGNDHGFEIAGGDLVQRDDGVALGAGDVSRHFQQHAALHAAQRTQRGETGGAYARDAAGPIQDFAPETWAPLYGVKRVIGLDAHRQHSIGAEPGVQISQIAQAPYKQAGANQQHQR